jgi:hypothetical protein
MKDVESGTIPEKGAGDMGLQDWLGTWDITNCTGYSGLSPSQDLELIPGQQPASVTIKTTDGALWAQDCTYDENNDQVLGTNVTSQSFTITRLVRSGNATLTCTLSEGLIDSPSEEIASRSLLGWILAALLEAIVAFFTSDEPEPDSGTGPGSWVAEEGSNAVAHVLRSA